MYTARFGCTVQREPKRVRHATRPHDDHCVPLEFQDLPEEADAPEVTSPLYELLREPGVVHHDDAGGSAGCGQPLGQVAHHRRLDTLVGEGERADKAFWRGPTAGDLEGADDGPLKAVVCRKEDQP